MKKTFLHVITILIITVTGCKDQVKEHFESVDSIPVVNGLLIEDSVVIIHVSKTRGLDDHELEIVTDAKITLLTDDRFVERLSYQYDGYYRGETVVEAGHKYTCRVEIEGFELLNCEDSIPLPIQISTIKHINEATINDEGQKIPAVEFSFVNTPEQERFYQFIIHLQDTRGHDSETWRTGFLQETIDPVLLAEGLGLPVFSNRTIVDETYTLHVNYSTGNYSCSGDSCWTVLFPMILELRSISENYYNYLTQLKLYEQGRFPEFGAISYGVFPLYSNVKQGYGIFAGYSTVFSDTIYPNSLL